MKDESADIDGPQIGGLQRKDDLDKMLAAELNALSLQTRNEIQEEIHCAQSYDVQETPELVQLSLIQMRLEIQIVPEKDCVSYMFAVRSGRDYVQGDSYMLRFLRMERFQIQAAVKRFLSHVNFLQDIYGDFALQRPLRVSDLSKDEQEFLKSGRFTIFPTRDRVGRLCSFSHNTGEDRSTNLQKIRVWIYILCVMSEDEVTQQKGYVSIVVLEQESFAYLSQEQDHKYYRATLEALPVRLTAVHLCLPKGPMYKVLLSWFMLAISDTEQRLRTRYHEGIGIETRYKLMGYGIPVEDIPLSSSMTIKSKNHQIWLKNRRAIDKARELGISINLVEHPGINDVLFRMGGVPKCQGNTFFRQTMDEVLPSYISPPLLSKHQEWRRMIRERLMFVVKQKGGRFLGWNDGKWMQLNDDEANEKISNAIYNFIKRMNAQRSSQENLSKPSNRAIDWSKRRKLDVDDQCAVCICWKY